KSLRGEKMEDVIFNGTRSRAPMGMAEVTITLTSLPNGNGNGNGHGHAHGNGNGNGNGHVNGNGNGDAGLTAPEAPAAHPPEQPPAILTGPKDIVVGRRLYRSGESMYLLDGKPCRLRDIQDIFLG